MNQTREDIKKIESLWEERYNTLILSVVDYCKGLQNEEHKIFYDPKVESPVIHALDRVILELMKRKI